MSDVVISAATLEGFTPPPGITSVELRIYCSEPFVPNGEDDPVQSEQVGASSWFRKFTCTATGGNLSVPEVTLPATVDGNPATATYSARFYRTGGDNFFVAEFSGFESGFSLPTSTPTTWADIFAFNNPAASFDIPGLVVNMFTSSASAIVQNTTTETTLFGTASSGSTLTIGAGQARAGQIYAVHAEGTFTTTGSPTLRLRLKIGALTLVDTGAQTLAPTSGSYTLDALIHVLAIGASGTANVQHLKFQYISGSPGLGAVSGVSAQPGSATINFDIDEAIDLTAQWGAASASNIFVSHPQYINVIR